MDSSGSSYFRSRVLHLDRPHKQPILKQETSCLCALGGLEKHHTLAYHRLKAHEKYERDKE